MEIVSLLREQNASLMAQVQALTKGKGPSSGSLQSWEKVETAEEQRGRCSRPHRRQQHSDASVAGGKALRRERRSQKDHAAALWPGIRELGP